MARRRKPQKKLKTDFPTETAGKIALPYQPRHINKNKLLTAEEMEWLKKRVEKIDKRGYSKSSRRGMIKHIETEGLEEFRRQKFLAEHHTLETEQHIIDRIANRLSLDPRSKDMTLALLFNEYADMHPRNLEQLHEYRLADWEIIHGETNIEKGYVTDWPEQKAAALFDSNLQAWLNGLPGFLAGYYNSATKSRIEQEDLLGGVSVTFGEDGKESPFWERLKKYCHENGGTLRPDLDSF